jgi:hypothetical protein
LFSLFFTDYRYSLLIIVYLLLIIVYSLLIIVYSLFINVYSLLIIFYSSLISVYSFLFIFNSLLIIFHSFLIFFSFFNYSTFCNSFVRLAWSRGRGEDWFPRGCEIDPTLRTLSLFSQEKSPEISGNDGKLRLITENFGTLSSKFPYNIGQSFSPPLTVWSGAIRSGWQNPA